MLYFLLFSTKCEVFSLQVHFTYPFVVVVVVVVVVANQLTLFFFFFSVPFTINQSYWQQLVCPCDSGDLRLVLGMRLHPHLWGTAWDYVAWE